MSKNHCHISSCHVVFLKETTMAEIIVAHLNTLQATFNLHSYQTNPLTHTLEKNNSKITRQQDKHKHHNTR